MPEQPETYKLMALTYGIKGLIHKYEKYRSKIEDVIADLKEFERYADTKDLPANPNPDIQSVGEIMPTRKVVFRNAGGSWVVDGFALVLMKEDKSFMKIPVEIHGNKFFEIPDGARIIGIDYAPKIQISMVGRNG